MAWFPVRQLRPCEVCGEPSNLRHEQQYVDSQQVLRSITVARCALHAPRISGLGQCLHEDRCKQARRRTA